MNPAVWSLSAFLFACGSVLLVFRGQLLAMLLGLELMLIAANLSLVSTAGLRADPEGLCVALLVIALSAAEAVVGLTLILRVSRLRLPAEAGVLDELKG